MKKLFILFFLLFSGLVFGCCDEFVQQLLDYQHYTQDEFALREMLAFKSRILKDTRDVDEKKALQNMILFLKVRLGEATSDDLKLLEKDDLCSLMNKAIMVLYMGDKLKQLNLPFTAESLSDEFRESADRIETCYYQQYLNCCLHGYLGITDERSDCSRADSLFHPEEKDKQQFLLHREFRRLMVSLFHIKPKMNKEVFGPKSERRKKERGMGAPGD